MTTRIRFFKSWIEWKVHSICFSLHLKICYKANFHYFLMQQQLRGQGIYTLVISFLKISKYHHALWLHYSVGTINLLFTLFCIKFSLSYIAKNILPSNSCLLPKSSLKYCNMSIQRFFVLRNTRYDGIYT